MLINWGNHTRHDVPKNTLVFALNKNNSYSFYSFQNTKVPGLLYFLFGGSMFLSAIISLMFPETKGKALEDQIQTKNIDFKETEKTNKNENGI